MKARLPLLELLLCGLCLWAAWYHTPAGALVRTGSAWVLGFRSSARPLLAYYGAGTLVPPRFTAPPLAGPVPPAEALGYGAWSVGQQGEPAALAARIDKLAREFGSEDAGVVALFCGEEAARYAVARAGPKLIDLARVLAPRTCVTQAAQAMMTGNAYALAWPLPETVRITSPFGMREHPVFGGRRLHAGVDLGASPGMGVRATADGVVRRASSDGINGRIVVLDHGRGVVTMYCHNDEVLVRDGDRVRKGQVVARSGNSGRSTGPHLHYQLDLAGEPVDPLRFRSQRPKSGTGPSD